MDTEDFIEEETERVRKQNIAKLIDSIRTRRTKNNLMKNMEVASNKVKVKGRGRHVTYKIKIGWQNYSKGGYHLVTAKTGGGIRTIEYNKDDPQSVTTLTDLGKKLFFPGGISSLGNIDEFEVTLANYKGDSITDFLDLEGKPCSFQEHLKAHGLYSSKFNVYLRTKLKAQSKDSSVVEENEKESDLLVCNNVIPPKIDLKYSKEKSSLYSSNTIQIKCNSSKDCFMLSGMPEEMQSEYNPIDDGFNVCSIAINGKKYLTKTIDGTYQFPESHQADLTDTIIVHGPSEIFGMEDNTLILGLITSHHNQQSALYQWFKDGSLLRSGCNMSILPVTEPGIYIGAIEIDNTLYLSDPPVNVEKRPIPLASITLESTDSTLKSPDFAIPSVAVSKSANSTLLHNASAIGESADSTLLYVGTASSPVAVSKSANSTLLHNESAIGESANSTLLYVGTASSPVAVSKSANSTLLHNASAIGESANSTLLYGGTASSPVAVSQSANSTLLHNASATGESADSTLLYVGTASSPVAVSKSANSTLLHNASAIGESADSTLLYVGTASSPVAVSKSANSTLLHNASAIGESANSTLLYVGAASSPVAVNKSANSTLWHNRTTSSPLPVSESANSTLLHNASAVGESENSTLLRNGTASSSSAVSESANSTLLHVGTASPPLALSDSAHSNLLHVETVSKTVNDISCLEKSTREGKSDGSSQTLRIISCKKRLSDEQINAPQSTKKASVLIASDEVSKTYENLVSVPRIEHTDLSISEQIGQGAFGVVYKGEWLETTVAVKKIKVKRMKIFEKTLHRELQIHSRIRHPNIVQLMAYTTERDSLYLVSEYIEGHNLEEIVFGKENGVPCLDIDLKCSVSKNLLQAVCYLHNMNPVVVHRDIKLENVLASTDLKIVKLCDMGLSKLKTMTTLVTTFACKQAIQPGTPAYQAPELVVQKKSGTVKSDVWSLSCTILEILIEDQVWNLHDASRSDDGDDDDDDMSYLKTITKRMKKNESPDGLSLLANRSEVPRAIVDIIFRGLSYEKDKRPTALEMLKVFKTGVSNV